MQRYEPLSIESKWQRKWADDQLYAAEDFSDKQKFVMLTEFPYPSGDGLHLGHAREYTLGDILARHKRMQGYNVLYPMGYDAFGLPTENYAIKNHIRPQDATDRNVGNFQKQFERLGYSIDWSRSFRTSDPDYYRWTQWLFLQFYKHGLAYQDDIEINWCPKCKTGLANEEVVDGKHERCGTPVEKKQLKQWMLKITQYADKLIDNLEQLDFPPRIADQQINWIGRSVGAEIEFEIASHEGGFRSYVMGQNNISKEDFEKIDVTVHKVNEKGHFLVSFTDDNIKDFEDLISKKLEPGFWNEYVGKSEAVFISKDIKGEVERTVWSSDTEKHLLDICSTFAKTEFTSIKEMLVGNSWYASFHASLKVFTTRPDTLYGATFMVLAPEHELVSAITTDEQRDEVEAYVKQAQSKSEVERQDADREKTGVFTGAYAINPLSGDEIPIWIADYVLAGYGTGAIMAVPAHDERDYAFAKKFDLPVKPVIAQDFGAPLEGAVNVRGAVAILYDEKAKQFGGVKTPTNTGLWLNRGGSDDGETFEQTAIRELAEETGFKKYTKVLPLGEPVYSYYFNDVKKIARRSYGQGFLFYVDRDVRDAAAQEAHETDFDLGWYDYDELITDVKKVGGVDHWLEMLRRAKLVVDGTHEADIFTGDGVLVNSGPYDGVASAEAREQIVQHLAREGKGKERVNYRLRDWIFSRQHYWGEPIPIIHCGQHGAVAVPDEQLPVTLPDVEHYEPTDTGESPLAAITDWVNTTCPTCGGPAKRETDTMPNWAGSSWYYLRYYDAHNDKAFADQEKLKYWGMVDLYLGGMEHTTLHLLYSRFWHEFFYDIGLVPTKEPYAARRGQGIILAEDGRKMSKSLGNVINPLDVVNAGYGADALRLAIAFIAPYDMTTPWNPEGVAGTHRFLSRVWALVQEHIASDKAGTVPEKLTHQLVKKVSDDLDDMRFNTAVAAMMEYTNELYKLKAGGMSGESWRVALKWLLKVLAPFAPHMSEELWSQMGFDGSVHVADWPKHDESKLIESTVKIVVQVNGKVRATLEAPADATKEQLETMALEHEKIVEFLDNKKPTRVVVVPGRLVNIVV
ncbi:MAG: class I tRNA ligase family protein [Acidobacteriota bacterium]